MPLSFRLDIASRRKTQLRNLHLELGQDAWHGRFQAMGSPCELVCEVRKKSDAHDLAALVAAEAWRIEDKFSRYRGGNIVDRINSAAGLAVDVDEETADLLDFSVTLYQLSERRFDITSGALRRAWTFDGGDQLPKRGCVIDALRRVGWHRVDWHRPTLRMEADMEIDLGGVGKEYAVDRCAGLLRELGCRPCLVNFGGDLAATEAPVRRGHWTIAVEGASMNTADRIVRLHHGAIATSGDARRFLLKDGVRYSHILDPITGWPVPDAPRSVTVVADTCVQAGMLSTLAMLKGAEAEAFLEAEDVVSWCRR